jgi:hypothetical protein
MGISQLDSRGTAGTGFGGFRDEINLFSINRRVFKKVAADFIALKNIFGCDVDFC